jgi:Holliday junction resolvase
MEQIKRYAEVRSAGLHMEIKDKCGIVRRCNMNSRAKGARGERELARKLREYGYSNAKRSQQYCGANGDADIIDALPGIHIECKRVERLNIDEAMLQAIRDRREGEYPAVFHRKNNGKWMVTMLLDDWQEIYREWRV